MITCTTCQLSWPLPLFHCPRCADSLLEGVDASGNQIVLRFAGGVARSVVVYRNQQPIYVEEVRIEGANVRVKLAENGQTEDHPAASLFDVLLRGRELWNLD
jgi:hypothetical protein